MTFKYHVPYFVIGLILTLLAVAIFVLIYVLNRRKEKKTRKKISEFIESYAGTETADAIPEETVSSDDPPGTDGLNETSPEVPEIKAPEEKTEP